MRQKIEKLHKAYIASLFDTGAKYVNIGLASKIDDFVLFCEEINEKVARSQIESLNSRLDELALQQATEHRHITNHYERIGSGLDFELYRW